MEGLKTEVFWKFKTADFRG